ncbi:MAG: hypothetical protein ACEQSU_09470 [Microgenomates group bacterium]
MQTVKSLGAAVEFPLDLPCFGLFLWALGWGGLRVARAGGGSRLRQWLGDRRRVARATFAGIGLFGMGVHGWND